jgi:cell division protein FtsX
MRSSQVSRAANHTSLVSVPERTCEIGICEATRATEDFIRWQFIPEGVLLSMLGRLARIVAGSSLARGGASA